jgi:hypothetical protein
VSEKPKEPFLANARLKDNDMTTDKNQNPEQIARDKIDKMLIEAFSTPHLLAQQVPKLR